MGRRHCPAALEPRLFRRAMRAVHIPVLALAVCVGAGTLASAQTLQDRLSQNAGAGAKTDRLLVQAGEMTTTATATPSAHKAM
jgi:hypothetical protein